MGRPLIDLVGQTFGRLKVIELAEGGRYAKWWCVCTCGNRAKPDGSSLRNGSTTSCGCNKPGYANRTHGRTGTAEHRIWAAMLRRCRNPNVVHFENYGGRGITVCTRWLKFENFYADMGLRPSNNHSIDRVDNDKGYSLENCRWATREEQSLNTSRTHWMIIEGKRVAAAKVAAENGVKNATYRYRLRAGWPIEEAVR